MVFAATQDDGDIWVKAAAEDHIWVCGLTVTGVSVDVYGPDMYVLKLQGHGELAPSFSGPERSSPDICWPLQWESGFHPSWESWPSLHDRCGRADPNGMGGWLCPLPYGSSPSGGPDQPTQLSHRSTSSALI